MRDTGTGSALSWLRGQVPLVPAEGPHCGPQVGSDSSYFRGNVIIARIRPPPIHPITPAMQCNTPNKVFHGVERFARLSALYNVQCVLHVFRPSCQANQAGGTYVDTRPGQCGTTHQKSVGTPERDGVTTHQKVRTGQGGATIHQSSTPPCLYNFHCLIQQREAITPKMKTSWSGFLGARVFQPGFTTPFQS